MTIDNASDNSQNSTKQKEVESQATKSVPPVPRPANVDSGKNHGWQKDDWHVDQHSPWQERESR